MGGKGRKLRELVLPLSVKVGDQRINFEYQIGRIDHEWERAMNEAQGPAGSFRQIAEEFVKVVRKWNYDEDYVKVPEAQVENLEDEGVEVRNGYRLATDDDYDEATGEPAEHVETRRVPLDPDEIVFARVPTPVIGLILFTLQQDAQSGGAQSKKG